MYTSIHVQYSYGKRFKINYLNDFPKKTILFIIFRIHVYCLPSIYNQACFKRFELQLKL